MADYVQPRPYPPLAPGSASPGPPVTLAAGFIESRPYPPTATAPAPTAPAGGTIPAGSVLDFSDATNSGLLAVI